MTPREKPSEDAVRAELLAGKERAGEPATQQDDATEPAGEQDAGNEAERDEATERPESIEEAPPGSGAAVDASADDAAEESAEDEAASAPEEGALARAERERAEYLALAQRAQADFENYRKRAAKEAAAAAERAKGGLVRELLPVVDNLERALESAGEGEEHLADGVRLVYAELIAVLERTGVEQYDPAGERFDPTFHEALSTRAEEGAAAGVVLDVAEKGYRLNGTVLRPARVVVSG